MTAAYFRGINVVSIAVPDLAAARQFYAETLGLGEPVYDLPGNGWIEFRTGGPGNLALTPAGADGDTGAATTVVLNTPDAVETCRVLREKGVPCDEPVHFEGYVVYCTFYDPWGNRLQMCSPG